MIGFDWPFETSGVDVTGVTPLFRYSNYVESVLWTAIGVYVFVRAKRKGIVAPLDWLLAVTFVIFGGSDIVEANTGAWWRPIWLLFWKGSCLLGFLCVFVAKRRSHRPADGEPDVPGRGP